jgi:FkbM family methyltransferase
VGENCDPAHYFDHELLTPVPDEVSLDCGTYHLENALEFRQFCGGKYKKIFAFEASKENFSQAKQIAEQENMECLTLLNAAVWSSNEILHFNDRGGTGSALSNGGSEVVKAVTIDEIVGTEKVTLIKMDIEGAELEALRGAAETIKRRKPRMAISVYHKETDIIEIPKFILSLKPDYQVYIRPERFILSDVVMYFV